MAARLRPRTQIRCPRCLGQFPLGRCLARCGRGCKAQPERLTARTDPDAARITDLSTTLSALVFNPRHDPGKGLLARLGHQGDTDPPICPGCHQPAGHWICPLCGHDLPPDSLEGDQLADCVVIGPMASGKSTYAAVVVEELERLGQRAGFVIDPANEASRRRFASQYRKPVYGSEGGPPSAIEPTAGFLEQPGTLRPLVFRIRRKVGQGQSGPTIALFDTSGRDWELRREAFSEGAPFLSSAEGILFVLDPLRISSIREELRRRAGRFAPAAALAANVDLRPLHLADEIRGLGALLEHAGQKLPFAGSVALVLSKLDRWGSLAEPGTIIEAIAADGAPDLPWTPAIEARIHDELEALLARWTGEGFLQQMELKFPTHRYFAISALGDDLEAGHPPLPHPQRPWITRPLAWLLERQSAGIPLPAAEGSLLNQAASPGT